ncbi:MAG: type II toxin-antitoxin system death-on-curing family toxin [Magnetococcales bacterium]|nr:type II toxin-antitoxin system death-on-curing family toxin [Magnetococcales bacterium]
MESPIWIDQKVVQVIHKRQLDQHGGLSGIRDTGMLESALVKPINRYAYSVPQPTWAELATCYAFGIARNHPFFDGNKRVAYVVCLLFLRLHGYRVVAQDEEKYRTFLSMAAGTTPEDELACWIDAHLLR